MAQVYNARDLWVYIQSVAVVSRRACDANALTHAAHHRWDPKRDGVLWRKGKVIFQLKDRRAA